MTEKRDNNINKISNSFINPPFCKETKDNYFYRNQSTKTKNYRNLTSLEIKILKKNNNIAENWNELFVSENFNPNLIKNCELYGRIFIGNINPLFTEYHDLRLPLGIYNSTILSCEIGDNVVIKNVHYLAHYIIGDNCILFNIDEMITTDHSKFGNGIIKEGEEESIRIWLEICNENEGRKVLAFESMIPADAYIWSKYRNDFLLMDKLKEITDSTYDNKRGYYGTIGNNTIIKTTRIIKDTKIGPYAYIKGANKLKNLTILSSKEEPSQIGEGVELVNGIIGYGSKIFYGCKAVRFITGRNTQLKYGARLINSFLGDNSTVSCCELLNNLIFPFHEQHHNNSFLIASTVLGQSNIAAGATIGSNHNSRSPDGEIIAGRGFWPGLCTNFKHNSKFASFVLISKGSYDYELNIQYPFSLVSNSKNDQFITIMPAYWFLYNMYAIARNINKFASRDKRKVIVQNIETDFLAPDTISEMLYAINRIEFLIGLNTLNNNNKNNLSYYEIIDIGKKYIMSNQNEELTLNDPLAMKKFGALILKPIQGLNIYKDMCYYFIIKILLTFFNLKENLNFDNLKAQITALHKEEIFTTWTNIGGQIIPDNELENLKKDIKANHLNSWEKIHNRYDYLWKLYPKQKARYSIYVLEQLYNKNLDSFTKQDWKFIFEHGIEIFQKTLTQIISSREKDYNDEYKKITFINDQEMKAVLGDLNDNAFIINIKKETENFILLLKQILISFTH